MPNNFFTNISLPVSWLPLYAACPSVTNSGGADESKPLSFSSFDHTHPDARVCFRLPSGTEQSGTEQSNTCFLQNRPENSPAPENLAPPKPDFNHTVIPQQAIQQAPITGLNVLPAPSAFQELAAQLEKEPDNSVELIQGLEVSINRVYKTFIVLTKGIRIEVPFAELNDSDAGMSAEQRIEQELKSISVLDSAEFRSTFKSDNPLENSAIRALLCSGASVVEITKLQALGTLDPGLDQLLIIAANTVKIFDSTIESLKFRLSAQHFEFQNCIIQNCAADVFAVSGVINDSTFSGNTILGGNWGETVVKKTAKMHCTAPRMNLKETTWEGLGNDHSSIEDFRKRNRGFTYRTDLGSELLLKTANVLTLEKYAEHVKTSFAVNKHTSGALPTQKNPARDTLRRSKIEEYLSKSPPEKILKRQPVSAPSQSQPQTPQENGTPTVIKPDQRPAAEQQPTTPPAPRTRWFSRDGRIIGPTVAAVAALVLWLSLSGGSPKPKSPNLKDDQPPQPPTARNDSHPQAAPSMPAGQETPPPVSSSENVSPLADATLPAFPGTPTPPATPVQLTNPALVDTDGFIPEVLRAAAQPRPPEQPPAPLEESPEVKPLSEQLRKAATPR